MKLNKFIIVSIVMLTILFVGVASATEDSNTTATDVVVDDSDYRLSSPINEEITTDSDELDNVSNVAALSSNVNENSNEKLGVSDDNDALGIDYDYILTPEEYHAQGFDSHLMGGSYKFVGEFNAEEFDFPYFCFEGCIVDASEAQFIDMGIVLLGDVTVDGITITSTRYIEDDEGIGTDGSLVFITGDDNILKNANITYQPPDGNDVYGIYMNGANNFQLLDSVVSFTGVNIEEYYEYAMKIITCEGGLIQGNTITAYLPILNVDYSKGDPGLETDLVLNTGIKESFGINIIDNTFTATVTDRYGDYPTLDCLMMEQCGYINFINNTLNETDFITEPGNTNYLNVLDCYYTENLLIQGNKISVETDGGCEDAGTSYPIQLTGPYENVIVDGNDLYAHCYGPALGIFSQNYYGGTEITVQNNKIDVTGLPTLNSWGLVSGIELQDDVARVYNNEIKTQSITGSYDGGNLYGISYAQFLNNNHNYDIQGNFIETQGQYAIYLLQAQDTTITGNYLVSAAGTGDDTVYIQNAEGSTAAENNNGRGIFYVSPDGDNANPGSEDEPLQSIHAALDLVPQNGKIYLLEGTHILEDRIRIDKSISIVGTNRKNTKINMAGCAIEVPGIEAEKIVIENVEFINAPVDSPIIYIESSINKISINDCIFNTGTATDERIIVIGEGTLNFNRNTFNIGSQADDLSLICIGGVINAEIHNNIFNSLRAINNQAGEVNASTNYWGTNDPNYIDNYQLIIDDIVIAQAEISEDEIAVGDEATVTVNFNSLLSTNDGSITKKTNLIPDDITVEFKATGTIERYVPIENGIASATYTNDVAGEDEIAITVPNQEFSLPISVLGTEMTVDDIADFTLGYGTCTVNVLVHGQSGTVTIKVNGKTVATPSLSEGKASYTVDDEDLIVGLNTVEVTYGGETIQKTFTVSTFDLDGIVTNETFFNYFNKSNSYRLNDYVPEGATLDFQGPFISNDDVSYVMEINKPINMISSTKDAFINLNTISHDFSGQNPGDRFTVSFNGSGTNISDISFYNSQLWFFNAHNLNINNLTSIVENQELGSGVGVTAFRGGSSHIKVKNSYFYTKDNGGHSNFVLTNASYISIDNSSIIGVGQVGNLIYMNLYNIESDMYMSEILQKVKKGEMEINDHNNFTNCYIQGPDTVLGICILVQNMGSGHDVFENNTFVYGGSLLNAGNNAIVRNNTLIGGCSISAGANSIVEDNKVDADVTIASNTQFSGNIINGTLSAGSDNTITENYINSIEDYAITLGSNTGNTIRDNYLYSNGKKGNSAISGTGTNTIGVNRPMYDIQLTIAEDNIWSKDGNSVEVYINGGNGKVTIKVNDNTIATPSLTSNRVTQAISPSDIKAGVNTVEVTYDGESETATFYAYGLVTNETWDTYFDVDNEGSLRDFVPAGATLDFQGKFLSTSEKSYKMVINKPVNLITSTGDAYIDLDTTAGSLMGESPGDSFVINNAGSGTNVTGLYFHNSQMWLTNTHNVTLDGISVVVESKQIGSGVGVTAIRNNSTNVTVKNSYFYTKDNGGSTTIALSWADHCTIENNTILVEGNVGNMIYLNTYNTDIPQGVSYNVGNVIKNNVIWGNTTAAAIRWGIVINGAENTIDNNTIHYNKGVGLAAALNGDNIANNVFSNNKLYGTCSIGGMTPIANAVFHDNYVSGNVNVGANCELYDNTVDGTFTVNEGGEAYGNTIGGTLTANNAYVHDNTAASVVLNGANARVTGTVSDLDIKSNVVTSDLTVTGTLRFIGSNSVVSNAKVNDVVFGPDKNNKASNSKLVNSTIDGTVTFTARYSSSNELSGNNISKTVVMQGSGDIVYQNNITTTSDYAVDATNTRASDCEISDNYLISNGRKGNEAVTFASGKGHIIEGNGPDFEIAELSNIWPCNDQTVTVTLLPSFTRTEVTVKINNKVINETVAGGEFTQVIKYADMKAGVNTIEVTAFEITKTATFNLQGVITKDTVFDYFDQSNKGALFDFVPVGATLDFQGEIKATEIGNFNITISKPVNVISSTHDSYIDLNTTAGSLMGEYQGDCFTVNNGGSGSNITGIYIHNTQVWISNTHNVVFDNVSVVVEGQRVGSGVGTVSVRDNSSYVTIKNGYFYTQDNGGSSTLVMAWANHCTFDNNTVTGRGNIGNMIYSTTYNVYTAPTGYAISNDYNVIKNNNISNPDGGTGICRSITIFGSHNVIDNNTINKGSGFFTQWGSEESKFNNTYSNNKAYDIQFFDVFPNSTIYNNYIVLSRTFDVGQDSVAYNNTIVGEFSVGTGSIAYNNTANSMSASGEGAIVYDNIAETLTLSNGAVGHDNKISSTITVKLNSKAYNEHVDTLIVNGVNATAYNNTVKTLTVGGVNASAHNNTIGSPSGSLGSASTLTLKEGVLGVSLRDIYSASNGDGVLTVNSGAIAYDNTVNGETIIDGENIQVYESTLNGDVSISQSSTDVSLSENTITGTLTVEGSGNEIVDNEITSTDEYAIVLGSSENNQISGNTLYGANKEGNSAVQSSSESNTVGTNYPANTIYVSETGSEDNDGATRDTAVASFAKAYEIVPNGGEIIFLNGTYTISSSITIDKNVNISGEDNVTIKFNIGSGTYLTIDSTNVTLTNIKFSSITSGTSCILNKGNLSIDYCEFSGFSGFTQVILNRGFNSINNSKFFKNTCSNGVVRNLGSSGVGSLSINNTMFYDNTISTFSLFMSFIELNVTNSLFKNNTVPILISLSNPCNSTFINCTFVDNNQTNAGYGMFNLQSQANCTIKESNIINNNGKSSAFYLSNSVLDIADSVILNSIGSIFNLVSPYTVTAYDNWWGNNTKPVTGAVDVDRWVIMSVTPETATTGSEVTVTASFDKTNSTDGTVADYTGNLPDGINVTFTSTSGGLNEVKTVKDGSVSVTYIPVKADTKLAVTSSDAVVEIPVEIKKPDIVYVSETGLDDNDGETRETAVASLSTAIGLVAENGNIIFLNGTYTISSSITIDKNVNISGEDNVTIKFNIASGGNYLTVNSNINLTNIKFSSTTSGTSCINNYGNITIDYCEFSGFSGFTHVISNRGDLIINNTKFFNNICKQNVIRNFVTLTIDNTEFYGNVINDVSSYSVIMSFKGVNVKDSLFKNNTVKAGVISLANPQNSTIINCTFVDNNHTNANSGIITIQSQANCTIKESTIINNNGKASAFYLSNSKLNITDSVILNSVNDIFKFDSTSSIITANDNWWGNNTKPVTGAVDVDRWVIMSVTPETATSGSEVTVTASFDKTNSTDGTVADYTGNLPSDVLNVTFTSTSGGLNEVKTVKDGSASVTYTPVKADTVLTVTSSDAVVEIPVEIVLSNIIYVSETGLDTNDGETRETAVASLSEAYNLVAENGKIIVLDDIVVSSSLTIAKDLEIVGDDGASIKFVNAYITNEANLNITNITFKDSNSQYIIYSDDEYDEHADQLILDNCRFIDNVVSESVIYSYFSDSLTVNNTEFDNNTCSNWVVYSVTNTLINNSEFINNVNLGSSFGQSIVFIEDDMGGERIENSIFDNNTAQTLIRFNVASFSVFNCTIVNNNLLNSAKGSLIYSQGSGNVKESVIINNKGVGNSFYVTSNGFVISDSVILNGVGNTFVFTGDITATANDNWWGSNDQPVISGVTVDRWVIMSVAPETVTSGIEVTITASFDKTNSTSGVLADYTGNLDTDVLNVTFTSASGGLNEFKAVQDGQASVTYTPLRADGKLTVTSTNAVVDIPIEIGKINTVYVSPTGSDSNTGETRDTPVQTISHAIEISDGKIIVLAGEHIVDSNLVVNNDLEIIGEDGAIIKLNVAGSPLKNNANLNLTNLIFENIYVITPELYSNELTYMITNAGSLSIESCEFSGFNGGHAIIENRNYVKTNLTINNTKFHDNNLQYVVIKCTGNVNITNSEFYNNKVDSELLGIVTVAKDYGSKIENTSFYRNNASFMLYIHGDGTSVVNCSFEDNTITTNGVIYCCDVIDTSIDNSIFINNSDSYFKLKNSTVNILDSVILKEDSNIFEFEDNLNVVTANDNWWGNNTAPEISGVTIDRWVIMSVTPESATADEEVTIIASFDKTNSTDGTVADYTGNLHSDVLNVTFTSTSGGLDEVKSVKDGQASVTYTPARTDEKLTVTSTDAVVEIPVQLIVPDILIDVTKEIWLGKANSVTITVPDGTGTVTIKVNGKTIATPELSGGSVTQTIEAADIVEGENTVEITYDGFTNSTTFNALAVPDIVIDVTKEIWFGEGNSVGVTIADASGDISIRLNGVEIAAPTLSGGSATETISADDIVAGENTIEVVYKGLTNSTTFYAFNNVVTPENFNRFFDEGSLKGDVPFDELIFKGEFNAPADYIIIEDSLSIVGDGATLYNTGFVIVSDDVKVDNLTLIADTSLGSLIMVDSASDVTLSNLNITYDGGDEMAVAINVVGDNVKILNNTIFFESHVTDDSQEAIALQLVDCSDALVDGNNITAKLPCVYVNNYDEDYYMMGSDKVNPVRLKDCDKLTFTNNNINSTTNDCSADFPTIQSIQIIGCSNSILDHNNISMIDEMTPVGMDNYMYGINFGYNTNVTFSYNNFNMSTSGGKDAAGTAYAFQGVESEVIIRGNNITSISNGPNLGIYVASMYGGDSKLLIEDNFINVTGSASSSGSWALVSGIEIQNGDAQIYNNTIYTQNVNAYDENAYMYGISYAQWMYGTRGFDIQDNEVHTEGKYTISVIDSKYVNAEGNTLYAHDLAGDDSINPGLCEDVSYSENIPYKKDVIIASEDYIWPGADTRINITVVAPGNVTVKVNGREVAVQQALVDNTFNYTISAGDLIVGENVVEVIYNGAELYLINSNVTKINVLGNVVTNDTFYKYFDEYGNLRDVVPFDELVFKGKFSDLASYITIVRTLTITGEDAELTDIGFIIAGDGVTLDNMKLVAESDLGNLIDIAGENAVISNMNISYVVSEAASAVNVNPYANGAKIVNNTIYFESTVEDYASDEVTSAICVNSGVSIFDDEDPITGLVIDNNNITVVIPAFLADSYENEYYVMGLSAVNGVRINGAEDFEFTNNNLDVTTNRLDRTTPTFQALYVASSSGLIDGNNISMIDTFTPAGKDVYLYAMELVYDEDLVVSNNNFNLSTTGGKADAGSAYAIIAIASTFDVVKNNITTVSCGPNIGIYFPSRMGAPCDAVITGNIINVTGLATSEHNAGLVSGIEIQTGYVEIKDNTIYTYNIGEYSQDNYIYGISYAQDGSTPEAKITDNAIYTEGHYTISFIKIDDATITDNYLVSNDLYGDESVQIKAGEGNTVKDNIPIDPKLTISVDNTTVDKQAVINVSLNASATGAVNVIVNGKVYPVSINDEGKGQITVQLPASTYTAGVTFESDDIKFISSENETVFEVSKLDSEIGIVISDAVIDNNVTVNVTAPGATGKVVIIVDGKQHEFELENGNASYTIENITAGNHSVVVVYLGDDTHDVAINSTSISVDKLQSTISIAPVEVQFVGSTFTISVTNDTAVNVTINGESYDLIGGVVDIDTTKLAAGEYIVTASALESDKYLPNSDSITFKVVKYASAIESITVPTSDVVVGQNATIVVNMAGDEDGDVLISINGVNYTVAIKNKAGELNVTLPVKDYEVVATYLGSDKYNASASATAQFKVIDKMASIITITPPTGDVKVGDTVEIGVSTDGDNLVVKINDKVQDVVDGKVTYTVEAEGSYNIVATTTENETVYGNVSSAAFTATKKDASITIDPIDTVEIDSEVTIAVTNVSGPVTIKVNDKAIEGNVFTPDAAGTYVVTVESDENGTYYAGFATATFTVVKHASAIESISVPTENVVIGQNATVKVTMAGDEDGDVLISINGVNYTVAIKNKAAELNVALPAGEYDVAATYLGSDKYNASASADGQFNVVDKMASIITITPPTGDVKVGDTVEIGVSTDGDNLVVKINDVEQEVVSGVIKYTVEAEGSYNIVATTTENETLYGNVSSAAFTATKKDAEITIGEITAKVGDKITIAPQTESDGALTIKVNGEEVTGEYEIIKAGSYTVTVESASTDSYYAGFASTTFEVAKATSSVNVTVTPGKAGEKSLIKVNVTDGATGTVIVDVNGTRYSIDLAEGNELELILAAGEYSVAATYSGDDKYDSNVSEVETLTVEDKADANIKVEIPDDVKVGEEITINITGDTDADLVVMIDGVAYEIADGKVSYTPADSGLHNITVGADETKDFKPSSELISFIVEKNDAVLNIAPIDALVGDSVVIEVENITDGALTVKVNGKEVENNRFTVNKAGSYTITVESAATDAYNAGFASYTFNVEETTPGSIDSKANITIPGSGEVGQAPVVSVELPQDANGTVTVYVDGKKFDRVDANATVNIPLTDLPAGEHTIEVRYTGDDYYAPVSEVSTLTIDKEASTVDLTITPAKAGEKSIIKVDVTEGATGTVIVDVNGTRYSIDLAEGNELELILGAGEYSVVAQYSGDDKYDSNVSDVKTLTVEDKADANIKVEIPDDVKVGDEITINITADTDAKLTLTINGEVQTIIYADGPLSISLDAILRAVEDAKVIYTVPQEGIYNVTVKAEANSEYASQTVIVIFEATKKDAEITIDEITAEIGDKITVGVQTESDGALTVKINGEEVTGEYEITKAGAYTVTVESAATDAYNKGFATYTFNVAEPEVPEPVSAEVNVTFADDNSTVGVDLPADAGGNLTVKVDGRVVYDGPANASDVIDLTGYAPGDHIVEVTYSGDDKYAGDVVTGEFNVAEVPEPDNNVTVIVDGVEYPAEIVNGTVTIKTNASVPDNNVTVVVDGVEYPGEIVDGKVTIKTNVTEPDNNVTVIVDGVEYPAEIVNGTVVIKTNASEPDNNVTVIIDGVEYPAEIVNGTVVIKTNVTEPVDAGANITAPESAKAGEAPEVNVELPEDANGTVSVIVDGKEVASVPVENGTANISLDDLSAGEHTVEVRYSGDEKYAPTSQVSTLTVDKVASGIKAEVKPVTEGENAIINVTVDSDASGVVLVEINDNKYYGEIKDGKATVIVSGLGNGTFTAAVTYAGDDKYSNASTTVKVTVNAKEEPVPEKTTVNVTVPENIKPGESANVDITIPDATGNVTVIVDGKQTTVPLQKGSASVPVSDVGAGDHSVVVIYPGDETHAPAYVAKSFTVPAAEQTETRFTDILVADGSLTARLVDAKGNAISNANVIYTIDGSQKTVATSNDGVFTIEDVAGKVITFRFDGNDSYLATNTTVSLDINTTPNVVTPRLGTVLIADDFEQYSCDHTIGERGRNFTGQLVDSNGIPLANKTIHIGYNGINFERTTNATGHFAVQIGLQNAGLYTFAMSFLDDDKYNASFIVKGINIVKKPTSIVAKDKAFKAKTKTKKLTVTLKTILGASIDGKIYLKEGKKLTLEVNGKTYTAKTDANGKATFKITGLNTKGKYKAKISFAGDTFVYKKSKAKVKITVK